jgi:hypothetical protein
MKCQSQPRTNRNILAIAGAITGLMGACAVEPGGMDEPVETTQQSITNGEEYWWTTNSPVAVYYNGGIRPCSGIVIDAEDGWVLTAAHCVTVDHSISDPNKALPSSSVWVSDAIKPGLTKPASAKQGTDTIRIHGTLDLALVKVSPYTVQRGGNRPFWMAPPSTMLTKVVRSYGYGRKVRGLDPNVEDGTTGAGRLRQGLLQIDSLYLNDTWFVLYDHQHQNRYVIDHGDSGGPSLMQKDFGEGESERADFLVGVHEGSETTGGNSFDTVVSAGAPWIMAQLGRMYIYRLHSEGTTVLYLDVKDSNPESQAVLWTAAFSGSSAQHWKYDPNTKAIQNNLGKCMDVQWGNSANETPVWMYDCNGTPAQQWEFTENLAIRNANGKCLDVHYGQTTPGVPLQIYDCNGNSSQRWVMAAGRYY